MALHDVKFELPERPLGKVDIDFTIHKNKEVLGKLQISKGGVDWLPKNAKVPHKLTWTQLAKAIENYKKN